MKKLFSLLFFSFFLAAVAAQPFEPKWSSLDQRPAPQWWTDAKFGIFIHWGVYAVPSFSKVGEYAEWYWRSLYNEKPEYADFHEKNYGPGFTYADFVPRFRAELFEPEQWAEIFRNAGARYVVLTSKHHDGFCLWPNEEANRSWGRPWNAVDAGPRRDLLGDLTSAVRDAGLKMGYYYSLYEWFNPLYLADPELYVEKHMIPQFKDLVSTYQPSVIFSDGEWDHPDKLWKSEELIAWLYNESPSREDVMINDRWGKGVRHHHGGYYTTEYGSGLADATVPWEENRGMAYSYGYSRTESLGDYRTPQELILMLIDIVSRGGNLLLNVGPTADGRIPTIMQQRLTEMGKWLQINGEAIYETTTWDKTCQWSEGIVQDAERGEYKTEYDILKLTVAPEEGYAVKEVFFTRKGEALYAICPSFPEEQLILKDVRVNKNARITLLGSDIELEWRQRGQNLEVKVPTIYPKELPARYGYVFKIDGIE